MSYLHIPNLYKEPHISHARGARDALLADLLAKEDR